MHLIQLYILKMLLCSGILYGYYRVALYNERFHQWNRFYLLAANLLSMVIPMVEIPLKAEYQLQGLVYVIETLPATLVAQATPFFTTSQLLWSLLLIVSLVLLLRLLWGIYIAIYKPYRNGDISCMEDIDVIITETPSAPYSFFRLLFWRSDMDPESSHGKRVLQHELTHIRERHSADKLFTELLLIGFWFNPFLWLIKKELYLIHEFLADRKAIEQNNGAAFAEMILQTLNAGHPSSLTNPFFSSHLKRRLKMITTSNQPQFSYLRLITALIAMATLSVVLMLTIEKGFAQQVPLSALSKTNLADSINTIDVKAVNGKSRVTVIMKNGNIQIMPVEEAILKGYLVSPSTALTLQKVILADSNSATVDSITVKIKSGNEITSPIVILKNGTFREIREILIGDSLKKGQAVRINENPSINLGTGNEPLIIYAGLEITQAQMNQINPSQIESVDVLKGKSAIAVYGDKGKNGVIKIRPKLSNYGPITNPDNQEKQVVLKGVSLENSPIYVVDGHIISKTEMEALIPDKIERINVLKGIKAIEAYGEKGKNGVVVIELKKDGLK